MNTLFTLLSKKVYTLQDKDFNSSILTAAILSRMKLYLSSYGLGNNPDELIKLLGGKKRAAIIANATDHQFILKRKFRIWKEIKNLNRIGIKAEELDLRKYFGREVELNDQLS